MAHFLLCILRDFLRQVVKNSVVCFARFTPPPPEAIPGYVPDGAPLISTLPTHTGIYLGPKDPLRDDPVILTGGTQHYKIYAYHFLFLFRISLTLGRFDQNKYAVTNAFTAL